MQQEEDDRNRRAYERFTVGFKIRIYDVVSESGLQFMEESVLSDISGGGVCFLTHSPDLYSPGQRLHISISLPGTDELDMSLEGNATVAWVGKEGAEMQGVSVGISMDDLLDFKRRTHASADGEDRDA